MITTLINKRDNVEVIRDKIALILANESKSQMNLARAVGKDPAEWALKVYTERTNPWEQFSEEDPDTTPIINVWFDSASFSERGSNVVEMQKAQGTFNIDCIGYGISKMQGDGHSPADQAAAFEVTRAARLVRNIIMAGTYTYLDMRNIVSQRWPQSINAFRIQSENGAVQKAMGMRLSLSVSYLEFSPQTQTKNLESIAVDLQRASDGEVIASAEYQYPLNGEQ